MSDKRSKDYPNCDGVGGVVGSQLSTLFTQPQPKLMLPNSLSELVIRGLITHRRTVDQVADGAGVVKMCIVVRIWFHKCTNTGKSTR